MKYKTLIALLFISIFAISQTVYKKTTKADNGIFQEIIIGNWHHYFKDDVHYGSWYVTNSISYNYDKHGQLICKKIISNDSVYLYNPIKYAWSEILESVTVELKE